MKVASEKQKTSPTRPGEILRDEFLKRNGITQDQLADAIRMSRFTVNQLINGKRSVTAESALRLGKALGTSADFWLNLQRAVDLFEAQTNLGELLNDVRVLKLKKAKKKCAI